MAKRRKKSRKSKSHSKGHIPLPILERRLTKLARVVAKRRK